MKDLKRWFIKMNSSMYHHFFVTTPCLNMGPEAYSQRNYFQMIKLQRLSNSTSQYI
uniref:Uncharacterized protein n=1 Tax=Arundo donax TaxID=35708 RepID=A0A0A8ZGE0_ARUDO